MKDPEMPWLPAHADQDFDPLAYAGVEPSKETPMVVMPRGGAREVGRSCYQVDTEHGTYLVDCGLNQGSGDKWPDFRGLQPEQVDAVFLTHAHIDYSGGLPVLEARGFLDDDAKILATPPTIALARLLLEDSLKIHRQETNSQGREQAFTERDLERVFGRFEPVSYGGGLLSGVVDVRSEEQLVFQYGNAAHLLGSAWLSLQTNSYTVLFSGDIGGRPGHLSDITPPPKADLLVCESTYGATHSHKSFSDAQTTLYNAVERAIKSREPVPIPSFAVGRSQLLQLMFADRLHTLPNGLDEQVRLVVDGMAQQATDVYHEFVEDATFFNDAMVNRVVESGQETPFLPDGAVFPQSDADRRDILENADPRTGGKVPVIIAPSGMLSGGNSPRYLTEFAARYDSAKIILTGYQAVGTTGRVLQNHLKAEEDEITFETDANPMGNDWPTSDAVTWTSVEMEDGAGRRRVTRATIPAEWVQMTEGLSAHASQQGLRKFARDVSAPTVVLVHGADYAQDHLARDFVENLESVDEVTRGRILTPIAVSRDIEVPTPSITSEMLHSGDGHDLRDYVDHLQEQVGALSEDVAEVRSGTNLSESDVRRIVREELEKMQTE